MRLEQPILAGIFMAVCVGLSIVSYYVITANVYSMRHYELIALLTGFSVITFFMSVIFAKVIWDD